MANTMALAADLLRWTGGGALLRARPRWDGLLALNYHRIGDAASSPLDRDAFSAAAEAFDDQLGFLKNNADVISPAGISAFRRRASGRAVLITFDDGYRDNYDVALPILKRHGLEATFFICTGMLDRGGLGWWNEMSWMIQSSDRPAIPAATWFDHPLPLSTAQDRFAAVQTVLKTFIALPAERTASLLTFLRDATGMHQPPAAANDLWMSWDMVRELRDAGMTIGAHTDSHPLLGRLTQEQQVHEILTSRDRLTTELGASPKSFAYPIGRTGTYDVMTKRLVQNADFTYGFNALGGRQAFSTFDAYDVRRHRVTPAMTLPIFQAAVTLPTFFLR